MSYCTKCGKQMLKGTNFCPSCGAAVAIGEITSTAVDANVDVLTAQNESKYPMDKYDVGYKGMLLRCLKEKYADFSGRASCSEFWRYNLGILLLEICTLVLLLFVGLVTDTGLKMAMVAYVLLIIIGLAITIPSLAVTIRRLHDINKSGWFFFIYFIPIIGPFWMLILLATRGDAGPNRFGPRTSYTFVTPEKGAELHVDPTPSNTLNAGIIVTILILTFVVTPMIFVSSMVTSLTELSSRGSTDIMLKAFLNEKKQKTSTTQSANANKTTVINNAPTPAKTPNEIAVQDSTTALQNYYNALTDKNFTAAYGFLSDNQRNNLGFFDHWRSGYNTTLSTKLISASPTNISPDVVVYYYQLESRDSDNGRIKRQVFGGNVTMLKANNSWYIQDQNGQLLSSTYE